MNPQVDKLNFTAQGHEPDVNRYGLNQEYYNRNAHVYEKTSWYCIHKYKNKKITKDLLHAISCVSQKKFLRVLELGPGTGFLLGKLIRCYSGPIQFMAFEHSKEMCKILKNRFSSQVAFIRLIGESVSAKKIDAWHKDQKFDLIMGNSILHHLPDYAEVVLSLENLLDENGVLCFTREPIHRDDCTMVNHKLSGFVSSFFAWIDRILLEPEIRKRLWPDKVKAEDASKVAYHMFKDGVSTAPFDYLLKGSFRLLWLRKYNRRVSSFFSKVENDWLSSVRADMFGNTLFSIGLQKTSVRK